MDHDVVIIGAGLAGASAAAVLGRAGCRVVLVDPHASCPTWFKAEKIEPDQADLLRELGLMDAVMSRAHRIGRVLEAAHGRVLRAIEIEQYGVSYSDLVNAVREAVPASVERRADRVTRIETGPDAQRVTLAGGEVCARLVVLATGTGGRLHEMVGISKEAVGAGHSLSCGFDLALAAERPFAFDALTYFPGSSASRAAYLTVFAMADRMRANFFLYRDAKDPWVRAFIADPEGELRRSLPGLERVAGPLRVTGRVEVCPTYLYRAAGHRRAGVALIGDAFQSVDPVTGTGVSKALTDVAELAALVPRWLETPGMGADKIAQLYDAPRKARSDARSLSAGVYLRRVGEMAPLRWQAHHWRWVARTGLSGLRQALRSGPRRLSGRVPGR
ncbi:MAG TPA: FAD-dependent monooxygenase [Gemmatimonadaceae bacterium]|nr:FAD-dependent monooxygenase [Gemmatimonadaceae bacterium]